MDYTAAADKFEKDSDVLLVMLENLEIHGPSPERINLALAEAKRVRSISTFLVRQLARERDQLQPGGTSS